MASMAERPDLKVDLGRGLHLRSPVIVASGLTSTNYSITFSNGILTIGSHALSVTAADASRAYGATNPPLTGTLAGVEPGDNITANELGSTTAADLGILTPTALGAGVSLVGQGVNPNVTALTKLADLKGGAGIDLAGLVITNGLKTVHIDFSGAVTVRTR